MAPPKPTIDAFEQRLIELGCQQSLAQARDRHYVQKRITVGFLALTEHSPGIGGFPLLADARQSSLQVARRKPVIE